MVETAKALIQMRQASPLKQPDWQLTSASPAWAVNTYSCSSIPATYTSAAAVLNK